MTYDPQVPTKLKKTQNWFGSIISRPVDVDSFMDPVSPSGIPMAVEACEYIRPSPTLRPDQRIQIYNQQYWWRLLSTLHESFPLATRLFGYQGFNFTIAIPYLLKYPPRHWSLNILGDRLAQWVEEEYTAKDKALIYNAVLLDCAFTDSFTDPQLAPLSAKDVASGAEAILEQTCYLQPHVRLFQLPYDLFSFRVKFLKETPEHWLENDFPPLDKKQAYYVLFRNQDNDISWSEISLAEFGLLSLFQKGSSIQDACEWIEQQEQSIVDEASNNLHRWFQEWVFRQWLTLEH